MKTILVVTDMQAEGSGYSSISAPLFKLLSKNYRVIIVGIGYEGQEHTHPFSIIPCKDLNDLYSIVHNLNMIDVTVPDVMIVALDIPQQIQLRTQFAQYKKPYIAITPLENPPLTMSWTTHLMSLDFVFFISELGKSAAEKRGMPNVGHLQIGVDTSFWRKPTSDEKANFRKGMGIEDDEFVILTVAENQERKNLSAAFEVIKRVKEYGKKVRYVLLTRIETPFGWNLRDLSVETGINKEVILLDKGIPKKNLWGLYAMADCFLSTSKAEGLGLPVLEAMACGVPVVATNTGAMTELLSDGRGYLIPGKLAFIDVWGNSTRVMIDEEKAAKQIVLLPDDSDVIEKAWMYVQSRTWDVAVKQLSDKIEELTNVAE